MNIPVVDLDGDGDLDVVVTGKCGGPVWFENQRIRSSRESGWHWLCHAGSCWVALAPPVLSYVL